MVTAEEFDRVLVPEPTGPEHDAYYQLKEAFDRLNKVMNPRDRLIFARLLHRLYPKLHPLPKGMK